MVDHQLEIEVEVECSKKAAMRAQLNIGGLDQLVQLEPNLTVERLNAIPVIRLFEKNFLHLLVSSRGESGGTFKLKRVELYLSATATE